MAKTAILRSTTPLRKTSSRAGVTKQRFNPDACVQLAELFDIVVVGSTAADEVFNFMAQNLPRGARVKFRFYPRSFFSAQQGREANDDGRNAGWETILAENRIEFEPILKKVHGDRSIEEVKFDWRIMEDFVNDPNVLFVSGGEGQLFYSKASKFKTHA
jgi:hypothetical protein